MKVDGKPMRSIWLEPDGRSVGIVDQTALPHRLTTARLTSLEDAAHAIRAMLVRGAPLIGATAAYGVCLALRADASDEALARACCRRDRPRSTSNGRSTKWSPPSATGRAASASTPPTGARRKSARRTSPSTPPSGKTDCR
jgi:methylthioribose-1-phosphate isomerase